MSNEMSNTTYIASSFPGPDHPLPDDFGALVHRLQQELDMPIWLLIQCGKHPDIDQIGPVVANSFVQARHNLPQGRQIALVLDSLGGDARSAYQIATLVRRNSKGFTAVIPRVAKSAATLLSLGAESIILGKHAELGPLDAQYYDAERESIVSGLDEIQCLERLSVFALNSIDEAMTLLLTRTGKRIDILLPLTLDFIAQLTRPLFENVDVVHYTRISRILKVAEDYAVRLLRQRLVKKEAEAIASHLVGSYSEHGFVITREEAINVGLPIREQHTDELESTLDDLLSYLLTNTPSYIGQAEEVEVE